MKTVFEIIQELAADNSRLAKEFILTREKNNEVLKATFFAALNPYTNYFIKKIPEYDKTKPKSITLDEGISLLSHLSNRVHTGHAGIRHLTAILEQCTQPEVIEMIIDRDLRCGVSEATVNKIWPGLIPTFDVCLAHKDISHIKYPAFAQKKMDGARCHLVWDGFEAKLFSRNGKQFELDGMFSNEASALMQEGDVFDGELVFYEGEKPMSRKMSNGLANKSLKGTITQEEADKAVFVVWDVVNFEGKIPYYDRWTTLMERFEGVDNRKFKLCETCVVKDEDDAQKFFNEMLTQGEEGAILKNFDFKWEPKRVKGVGKMKAELDSTLEVVGVEEGTGKNTSRLGALVCQSKNGVVKVNVGTGFSDEEREEFWKNPPRFIDVVYNAIIDDKSTGQKSLFLPRFLKVRLDKTDGDLL